MRACQLAAVSMLLLLAACGAPKRDPGGGDDQGSNAGDAGLTCDPSCPDNMVCSQGQCKTPCAAAEDNPSNVGCDFWAVDLDNEGSKLNNAAAEQFSVVAANDNDFTVKVVATKNAARVGDPVDEQAVVEVDVPPHTAGRIDLPQREVDGTMGQNGTYMVGTDKGTFVSPHGYHVVSNGPITLYQFNPIVQDFSNDASTLIPKQAVGTDYTVIGYETANPCAIDGIPVPDPSIPDHTSITILPLEDNTHVTVVPTHPIMASSGDSGIAIAATPKGGTLEMTLSRYTVANLESDQSGGTIADCMAHTGDFSGSTVHADKPVAVFVANERGIGLGGATNAVMAPGWDDSMNCCTDHLEEQLLPTTALGKQFAVARSPIRSTDPSWTEPDIIRVVGTVDGTNVTTNLPSPYDHFTVGANQKVTFAVTTGFVATSDQPIELAQYLISQDYVVSNPIGDPSSLLIPAAEQHRKEYVFLVPATFEVNYIVLARPVGANITLDGTNIDQIELDCSIEAMGELNGVPYEQKTCKLSEGQHTLKSDVAYGLAVYGYYNVGSYAFVGGSDVKIINPIE